MPPLKLPARNKNTRSSGLVKHKPLPPGWQDSQHYWFYGWAVTEETLRDYVLKHCSPRELSKDHDDVNSDALFDLRRQSGFYDLAFVGAIPDADAIAKGLIYQYPGQEGPEVHLMALSSTCSERLYRRRPTKEQLAKLTELFGEEPRWFEDCHLKKDFVSDLMDSDSD
ncbi:hypothetical protein BDN70DRAFT_919597 [Pholiota conissans]|uniref:Uncharacterized protein n=1 Tax=Pholiota conissans TaxID=109636 RepID=A0A9P5Z7W4_9AGAR|nr:hypothetical protein BDN70DRAFT_919597 [Pholiota conissans]